MESIGQRMKRIRFERDLSIREAAERAKVATSTYREWEEGRQIKGEPYEKIAEALNVTLYELLTGRPPQASETLKILEEIESACRNLKKSLEPFMN